MKNVIRFLVLTAAAVGLVVFSPETTFADIVIGSFDSTRSQRPFMGADYSNLRSNLSNAANFGPGGIVNEAVSFAPEVSSVTAGALSGLDVFVITEVQSLSGSEVTDLTNFVMGGGSLVLVTDSTSDGQPGASLMMQALDGGSVGPGSGGDSGATVGTIGAASTASTGPFGNLVGGTFAATLGGTLNPGSATTVIGRTSGDTFNILAEIAPGALGAGSGGVLIATDVLFMNFFVPPATYADNANNALLFENFIASSTSGPVVPEPSTLAIAGLSGLILLGYRLRRQVAG